jgi:methyl-accepting chemotaxis protein
VLDNLGIRGRLFLSFGGMIGLIAAVGGIGVTGLNQLQSVNENLYKNQLQGAVYLWKLRYGFPQFLVDPSKRASIKEDEPKQYAVIKENFEKLKKLDLTPEEDQSFKAAEAIYSKYIAARPRWFDLIEAGKTQEAAAYRAVTTTPFGKQTVDELNGLINLQRTVAEQTHAKGITQERQMVLILLSALIIAVVLAVVLTWFLSSNITKPVLSSVQRITSSSNDISATVEQQERTISEQAASVNETTKTMEEMGAFSRQAAEQADASAAGAQKALGLAQTGTQAVQLTMQGMTALQEQVQVIAEQIILLSEQTGQISGISDLVADLANQTNMLALNAAVEAARAGEQGKGFSVVASEIRKLAEESKKAAGKINILVTEVQASMNNAVMVTDEGSKKTADSIRISKEMADTFSGVTEAVNDVFANSEKIAFSSKQQAVSIQQVISTMNALNLGAQETTTGISHVRNTTEQLSQAAEELKRMAQKIMMTANA